MGVTKMVLQIVAKMCKLSWFDNLDLPLVDDVLKLIDNSSDHILIGLHALE